MHSHPPATPLEPTKWTTCPNLTSGLYCFIQQYSLDTSQVSEEPLIFLSSSFFFSPQVDLRRFIHFCMWLKSYTMHFRSYHLLDLALRGERQSTVRKNNSAKSERFRESSGSFLVSDFVLLNLQLKVFSSQILVGQHSLELIR